MYWLLVNMRAEAVISVELETSAFHFLPAAANRLDGPYEPRPKLNR